MVLGSIEKNKQTEWTLTLNPLRVKEQVYIKTAMGQNVHRGLKIGKFNFINMRLKQLNIWRKEKTSAGKIGSIALALWK